jgi:hypothetical protein
MLTVFLGQFGGFSGAFAEVIELGTSRLTAADGDNIDDIRGMEREYAFDAFADDDAADGEHLVYAVTLAGDDGAGEDLDAFLVAFDYFAVDVNGIAYAEKGYVLFQAFTFNGIQQFCFHGLTPSLLRT